jgi:hypothetical protein
MAFPSGERTSTVRGSVIGRGLLNTAGMVPRRRVAMIELDFVVSIVAEEPEEVAYIFMIAAYCWE